MNALGNIAEPHSPETDARSPLAASPRQLPRDGKGGALRIGIGADKPAQTKEEFFIMMIAEDTAYAGEQFFIDDGTFRFASGICHLLPLSRRERSGPERPL